MRVEECEGMASTVRCRPALFPRTRVEIVDIAVAVALACPFAEEVIASLCLSGQRFFKVSFTTSPPMCFGQAIQHHSESVLVQRVCWTCVYVCLACA